MTYDEIEKLKRQMYGEAGKILVSPITPALFSLHGGIGKRLLKTVVYGEGFESYNWPQKCSSFCLSAYLNCVQNIRLYKDKSCAFVGKHLLAWAQKVKEFSYPELVGLSSIGISINGSVNEDGTPCAVWGAGSYNSVTFTLEEDKPNLRYLSASGKFSDKFFPVTIKDVPTQDFLSYLMGCKGSTGYQIHLNIWFKLRMPFDTAKWVRDLKEKEDKEHG